MRPWGNAEHKKLNMALLLLLVAALLALAGVLFVRTKPDAVSPDNHIETTQKLSMTMSRTALFGALNGEGSGAALLDAEVSLPGAQEAMGMAGMLPGDSVEKAYTVSVKYSEPVKLHFGAALRSNGSTGGQLLAEGLLITVYRDGKLLYDGTVAGLAESKQAQEGLEILEPSPTKLTYTIKVTLPTSAGNEYQDKTVTVDLKWWLTSDSGDGGHHGGGGHHGSGEVVVAPKTGDAFPMELMTGTAVLALVLLAVLLGRRRARHD